ncbi:MAG: DUF1294 domain-containing protein [Clostridia bacterium]|nr:DUF1294 domain-containing protein [Clostridia bacterium]MBO4884404.1 DUF1294 domain-containing protein [Clostridia bacterium]MBR4444153.1 DUF1294 domain-containing protein [Clostridia bacterium]
MDKITIVIIALAFVAVMNAVSFALMGHDKKSAREGKRRVSEKRLFLAAACFGGLGGVLGMKVFRHKTQHWYFRVFFPALLVLQIALLAAGAYFLFR